MKTIRLFAAMLCMALLVPVLTGCDDDDTTPSGQKPEITIAKPGQSDVTATSVTFEIRTANADKAAWTILESTVAAPSASAVLQNGTALTGQSPYSVTADGLNANTGYTIYAVAANGTTMSEVVSEAVTTLSAVLPVALIKPLAESDVTPYSVTFEVSTENADMAAWMILEKTAEAPTAQKILTEGTQLSGQSPYSVTADGLNANTDYTIYVVAAQGDVVSEVVSVDATTAAYAGLLTVQDVGKNYVSYHIEAEADYRHLIISRKTYDSFTGYASTPEQLAQMVTLLLSLYGQVGNGPADYTLRDLDPNPSSQRPYDVLAGMPYVAIACQTDASGQQYTGSYQVEELQTLAFERLTSTIAVEIKSVTPVSVDLMCTPDAGLLYYFEHIYTPEQVDAFLKVSEDELEKQIITTVAPITELGKLSEWGGLTEQTSYIHCAIGVDAEGNRTEVVKTPFETTAQPEVDLTNLHFDRVVEAAYYGEVGPGVYDFYMVLSDQPMELDDYGDYVPSVFPCHTLVCDFLSAATSDGRVAEGTYTYENNSDKSAGTLDPAYTFAPYYGQSVNDYQEFWFETGTITVAYEGENYRITANLTTDEGNLFTGSYVGPIDFSGSAYASAQKMLRRRGMPGSSVMHR